MEKLKTLPAMRVLAIAVVIAIVFGLSAVMMSYTASAEDSTTTADDVVSQLGTLGNYECIKFKAGQKIDFMTLYNVAQSHSTTFVNGAIFGYKDGKFTSFTNNGFTVRPSSDGAYNDVVFCSKTMYGTWLLGEKSIYDTVYAQFGAYQSSYCSMWIGVKDNEPEIRGLTKLAASAQDFYDANGDTMYLVYTGSDASWGTQEQKDFRDDIINHFTDRDYKDIDTDTSPSAEFTNFKGTDEAEPYLFFVDWFDTGNRLPLADFRIDDNANYHSYSLRISTNKQYVETLKSVWAEQEVKEAIALSQSLIGNVCIPLNYSQLIKRVAQLVIIKKVGTFSYNVERNISSDLMRFDDSSNVNSKGISICLSDYVTIIPYCIYKLEIIDNNTSSILDTVYFNSENGYSKGNSGYGTKVNDYENKSDLDDDLNNNNGFTGGTPSNGDVMNIDDPADITDMDNIKAYGDLDITSIFNSLQSSSRALASFFQMCMNIIPAGILAIILGGLSIVIILRILGR